jgi:hypothetical protein
LTLNRQPSLNKKQTKMWINILMHLKY